MTSGTLVPSGSDTRTLSLQQGTLSTSHRGNIVWKVDVSVRLEFEDVMGCSTSVVDVCGMTWKSGVSEVAGELASLLKMGMSV